MKREIDSFIIGGTKAGPSMPGPRLQRMIGSRIGFDFVNHELSVPTPHGTVIAHKRDRIVLYDDDTLEVQHDEP